jgi:hypothetical protein
MSIEALLQCFTEQIQHEPVTARANGLPVFGPAVPRLATYQPKVRLLQRTDGSQVLSKGLLFVGPPVDGSAVAPVGGDDRLTLPDGTQPPLLQCEAVKEMYSPEIHHVEVYV